MDAPTRKSIGEPLESYPEDLVRASYDQIVRSCVCSGLTRPDAEDLAQDLWAWLVRTAVPIALTPTPWFRGVIHNYILRYRRRTYCHRAHEGRTLENSAELRSPELLLALESNELLDRVSALLPKREKSLLNLIRCGHPLAEASRMLGIPDGSRDYYRSRLIAYARRAIRRNGRLAGR